MSRSLSNWCSAAQHGTAQRNGGDGAGLRSPRDSIRFWLAEAYPWWRKHSMEARSSTAITAILARETKKITIGWGIISPYTRHPVQIAMEARVLQDAAGEGRFLLGLGASKIFMKEIGEGEKGKEVGPATVMKEHRNHPRDAFRRRSEIRRESIFDARSAAERCARRRAASVPIYVGATGPVLQRLAGSHSDGLLTASITTPAFRALLARDAWRKAQKAGKDPSSLDLGVGDCRQHRRRSEDRARGRARNGGDVSGQQSAEHPRIGRYAAGMPG